MMARLHLKQLCKLGSLREDEEVFKGTDYELALGIFCLFKKKLNNKTKLAKKGQDSSLVIFFF